MENDRRVPTEHRATEAEVRRALRALTASERNRILEYADRRVWSLYDRDADDLVQEAMMKVLVRERFWDCRKPFARFLLDVIQSVASHWHDHNRRAESIEGASELSADDPSNEIPADRMLIARQRVERLREHFKGDGLLLPICDLLQEGHSGPEIQEELGLSEREFRAARKTMQRHARWLEKS